MKAVVILLDTLNRNMLEAYNQETWVKTPNISRLANKSVVFDNHWAGSLPCMPARRDLFTGRLAFLERGWGGMEPFDVTLQQQLRRGGIFSHMVTDHYHYFATGGENYCQSFDTWDFHRGQEGDPWVSRVQSPPMPETFYGQVRPQYENNRSAFTNEELFPGPRTMKAACHWLEENRNADQFLLMVEAFDPHEPFDCPQRYLDLYQDEYQGPRYDWPAYKKVSEPPEAIDHVRKRYAATLSMIDHWLGKLLDVMDRQKLWDDTMVILTTDHGFLLGEHEWTGKNIMHVYNEIAHLPLMVHVPGMTVPGGRMSAITQNIDIMPTILDYFQLPIPKSVVGCSLLGLLNEEKEAIRSCALYGMFGMTVNITDGKHTYLRAPKRGEQHACFTYTAMPTSFRSFLGANTEAIEMGRFLSHTDYPVYKIPAGQQWGSLNILENVQESLLFDLEKDYQQLEPIRDEQLESVYEKKLIEAMSQLHAPEEQYKRLGFAI